MRARHFDAAAYELGVLDDPAEFEEHLRGCGRCRVRVAEFSSVTGALAQATRLGYLPKPGTRSGGPPGFGGSGGPAPGPGSRVPGGSGAPALGPGSQIPGGSSAPAPGSGSRVPGGSSAPALGPGSRVPGGPAPGSGSSLPGSPRPGSPLLGGLTGAGDLVSDGSPSPAGLPDRCHPPAGTARSGRAYPPPGDGAAAVGHPTFADGAARRLKSLVFAGRWGSTAGVLLLLAVAVTALCAARPAAGKIRFASAACIVSPAQVVAGTGCDLRDLPWSAGFQ